MSQEWPEIIVNEWVELAKVLFVTLACYENPPPYLFRGQANSSWALKPSLLRRLDRLKTRQQHLEIEAWLTKEFLTQSSLYSETSPIYMQLKDGSHIERWAYMQHHGCATRLLDWTASAYIAAYFAVCEFPDDHGAVFIVAPGPIDTYRRRQKLLAEPTEGNLLSDTSRNCVTFFSSLIRPLRAVTQQSHFSAALDLTTPHDAYLLQACSDMQREFPDNFLCKKIIIPPNIKPMILQQLYAMNVTPHSLFPGLDGFGRTLSDLATLKAAKYP
jgi:hypothetical protein